MPCQWRAGEVAGVETQCLVIGTAADRVAWPSSLRSGLHRSLMLNPSLDRVLKWSSTGKTHGARDNYIYLVPFHL